jgi:DinB superfamily
MKAGVKCRLMSSSSRPPLAPPGAGLPKVELMVARLIFSIRCWRGNRKSNTAIFVRERELIRVLLAPCPEELCRRQVLIPRLRGLEDSSRDWSVWMTLDHLRIVHQSIGGAVTLLAKGAVPAQVPSTADVKPSREVDCGVVDEYEKSCDILLQAFASVQDLKTTTRYAHPWFGLLDAAGWHTLAAMHLGIHRRQVERILAQARH